MKKIIILIILFLLLSLKSTGQEQKTMNLQIELSTTLMQIQNGTKDMNESFLRLMESVIAWVKEVEESNMLLQKNNKNLLKQKKEHELESNRLRESFTAYQQKKAKEDQLQDQAMKLQAEEVKRLNRKIKMNSLRNVAIGVGVFGVGFLAGKLLENIF